MSTFIPKEVRERKLKDIMNSLSPVIKKHGKENVRWALTRWTKSEQRKSSLLKKRKEIDRELSHL